MKVSLAAIKLSRPVLTNVKKEIHLGITEKARRFVLPSFKFQSLFAFPFNALIIILPRHWFFIQY
jgi:hypothetical protein